MSEEPKTPPTIVMYFNWSTFQPDLRQYKPSNPLIEVNKSVALDVPLTPDLIRNATAIIGQQISNQTEDAPVLTPLGMRYCIDQFEDVMSNKTKTSTTESTDDDEWADVEEEHPTKSTDTEWDDAETDEPTIEKPDEKWNEDWN